MKDIKQILATLSRPFKEEIRKGCRDDVVIDGLGAYIDLWLGQARELNLTPVQENTLNRIAELFKDYPALQPEDRLKAIHSATDQIALLQSGKSMAASQSGSSVQIPNEPSKTENNQQKKKQSSAGTKKQVEHLSLFGDRKSDLDTVTPVVDSGVSVETETVDHRLPSKESSLPIGRSSLPDIDDKNEDVVGPVQIGDTPVSTDTDSLDYLNSPLQYVTGIGPHRAKTLSEALGIQTVGGLLEYYPRDYIDRSKIVEIYRVGRNAMDEPETIQGRVVNHVTSPPVAKGRKSIGKVAIYDGTGVAVLVNFGRRIGYIKAVLPVDTQVVISGKFTRRYNEIQTTDYEFEVFDEETMIHTKRIVPKYPLTAKLSAKMVRTAVRNALDVYGQQIPEILPLSLRQKHQLMDKQQAINEIHFPTSESHRQAAQRRLAFDEFFLLSLGMEMRKDKRTSQNGIQFRIQTPMPDDSLLKKFVRSLPFALTNAQKKVFTEIRDDMQSPRVMNRLIQGDVGSGKTVVAAMALLCAIEDGYQGALMVPTEILAEQHYQNLESLLLPLGVKVVLLKSDLPKSEREKALTAIADGSADLIVGTQALIQEGVDFFKLGLVIIDEQHRFGVMQRAMLRSKAKSSAATDGDVESDGLSPDVLVMTATPIPRTLSLTIYGDLNVSVIDELPPGRQKIETQWIKEKDRTELYTKVEREIRSGRQAYIVYPLVEESEKLEEVKAATSMAEHIQKDVFPNLRVGLLHGQMKSIEKQEVMTLFKAGELDILVATTVIEVGIDVPNATIMVIEHAERFGLAQLHQLRGRVGRGSDKSFCYLVATAKSEDSYRRIQVMVRTNNGFEIAEEDLNIRGPGEFFGTRQSGLPKFKIANIISDASLLESAKKEAMLLIGDDPQLEKSEHQLMKRMLQAHWKTHLEIASVG